MRADTAIGPYRTAAPIDPDTWSVDGPGPTAEARRVEGRPGADFDRIAARLPAVSHPHLWPVLAAGRIDGRAWIVRPPVVGGTLADRLAAGHHPPYKVAIDVGVAVLRALGTAHQAGFAHGSLDAGCIAWSDGLRVVGVGYGALVGRPADAADDVRAVARLVRELVPEPPGELRALLAAPMPTADAFCRALKTLDPALSQDRDFDFDQPTPPATPPPVVTAARPAPTAEGAPPQPESPADLPFEVAPASAADDEGWGVEPPPEEQRPPSRGAGWVVGSRDMVEASTEDTWGVGASPAPLPGGPRPDGMRRDHTGAIVHTVTTAARPDDGSQRRNPWATAAVAVAVIAVVLVAARVVLNHLGGGEALPEPTVAPGQLPIDGGPLADASSAFPPQSDDRGIGDGGARDGATGDGGDGAAGPTVVLLIGPVPGTVVRVEDSAVICEATRRCPVPIDVDYRIEAKGHISQSVSGDDLYDRRRIGELERVLQPVPPKAPRDRSRRRSRR